MLRLIIFSLLFSQNILGSTSFKYNFSLIDSVQFISDSAKTDSILSEALDFKKALQVLNDKSQITYELNTYVESSINKYLINTSLISRMLGLAKYYFPIFESSLDKYDLPLELKYLAIVESALNPRAKSRSGARGLWQFMYPTGKEYGLNVTSYVDERLDPLKSTEAACKYFIKLFDTFGDWNLVLAAYNAGPGYIQRKIYSTGLNNYWELRPYIRKETRGYIPKFMAISYLMENYETHNIKIKKYNVIFENIDTVLLKQQVQYNVLSELLCVSDQTISYLNPSFKNKIIPKNSFVYLPEFAANDYLLNTDACSKFISSVANKEILIDEKRILYYVEPGDYLGKISRRFDVNIFQIKNWNKLKSSKLNIGDKLVLYVRDDIEIKDNKIINTHHEYIVRKGDTLWDIAKKYKGLSVYKIKIVNNLKSDNLKPGSKILIPIT
tara:strand:+ start:32701 stop:34020 length:1320 start_codon:yes stop_codon:yes gene_type:complete